MTKKISTNVSCLRCRKTICLNSSNTHPYFVDTESPHNLLCQTCYKQHMKKIISQNKPWIEMGEDEDK